MLTHDRGWGRSLREYQPGRILRIQPRGSRAVEGKALKQDRAVGARWETIRDSQSRP